MKMDKYYQRRYRKENLAAARGYHESYIMRIKRIVFGHYCKGRIRSQCRGCPIRHIDLLSLDHIIPARAKTKRSKRNFWRAEKHGWNMWLWLKKMKFPKGFQILCLACNKAKGTKTCCPRYGKSH